MTGGVEDAGVDREAGGVMPGIESTGRCLQTDVSALILSNHIRHSLNNTSLLFIASNLRAASTEGRPTHAALTGGLV